MNGTTIEFLLVIRYIDSSQLAMMQKVYVGLWSKMRVVYWHLEKTNTPKVVNRIGNMDLFHEWDCL